MLNGLSQMAGIVIAVVHNLPEIFLQLEVNYNATFTVRAPGSICFAHRQNILHTRISGLTYGWLLLLLLLLLASPRRPAVSLSGYTTCCPVFIRTIAQPLTRSIPVVTWRRHLFGSTLMDACIYIHTYASGDYTIAAEAAVDGRSPRVGCFPVCCPRMIDGCGHTSSPGTDPRVSILCLEDP